MKTEASHRFLLASSLILLGVSSCDVRDKGQVAAPEGTLSLAPRLMMPNGDSVVAVDSVRIDVVVDGTVITKGAPYSLHSLQIDGIPVGSKWTMTVAGMHKASDGLHWPVWWQGKDTGTATSGPGTVQWTSVKVALGEISSPSLVGSTGIPSGSDSTLPFGGKLADISIRVRATDSVYRNDTALAPGSNTSGSYLFTVPVPSTTRIKIVSAFGNVTLDTLAYKVSSDPKTDTTKPTISFLTPSTDTVFATALPSFGVIVDPRSTSGIDSVVIAGIRLTIAPWQIAVPLSAGPNTISAKVYAANGKSSTASLRIDLPKLSGGNTPPAISLRTPLNRLTNEPWGAKNVLLSWNVTDSSPMGTVSLNGVPLIAPTSGTIWTSVQPLALGMDTFALLAKNQAGNAAYDTSFIFRMQDTTHPVATRVGARDTVLTFGTRNLSLSWTVTDSDGVASVNVNGQSVNGAGDPIYQIAVNLRKASSGYDTIFKMEAIDRVGNRSFDSVRFHIQKDTSRPIVTRGTGTADLILPAGSKSCNLSWTVTDLDTLMSVTVNGSTVVPKGNEYAKAIDLIKDTVGVVLIAVDAVGDTTKDSLTLRVSKPTGDTIAPKIVRIFPSQARDTVDWNTKKVALSWTITDNVGVGVVMDNGRVLNSSGGVWHDTLDLAVGQNTAFFTARDSSGNPAYDTVWIFRQSDTTHPVLTRVIGTNDTVLPRSVTTIPLSWLVSDNAIQSVSIQGSLVGEISGEISTSVMLPDADSTWILLVAIDSSGNSTRDSIKVRRLAMPTITPAGGSLSGSMTAAPVLSSNLPGAVLSYSTDKKNWTVGASKLISTSQILYARATVSGVTSDVDSAIFLYAPVISPSSGSYTDPKSVSITALGTTEIEYLLSSSPWTWYSYGNSLSINSCTKISARSRLGDQVSDVVDATYLFPPTFSPLPGTFPDSVQVSIEAVGADSTQWSLDGTNWKSGQMPGLGSSATYHARSWLGGFESPSVSATYQISHDTTLASVSVNGRAVFLGTSPILVADSLPVRTKLATVTASSTDPQATVTINNGAPVTLTNNTATVDVVVTNRNSSQTYTLKLFAKIPPPPIYDYRDGNSYHMTKIGTQTWMAQNLNFWYAADIPSITVGMCYGNIQANCQTYGRLYTWAEVLNGASSSATSPSGVQGICPASTHVPSYAEWTTLANSVWENNSNMDASAMMANSTLWGQSAGTDTTGFASLPGGIYDKGASQFIYGGETPSPFAYWWTASGYDSSNAYNWGIEGTTKTLHNAVGLENLSFSVRCVLDGP